MELTVEKECDIVILAEYSDAIIQFCNKINIMAKDAYAPIPAHGGCKRIKGIANKKYHIESIREQNRFQIVVVNTSYYKLIIAMIHNVSKLHTSEEEQKEILRLFHKDICEEEKKHNTKNTIVIGDFNANPFESSCIAANMMHAIPYIEELKSTARIIQGKEYQKFYNPMWKFMANRESPYATYYYNNSDMVNYYWNAYDQIIIRPHLLCAFEYDSLNIITETTNHQLLKNRKPNKEKYSDHLPLYCILREENII